MLLFRDLKVGKLGVPDLGRSNRTLGICEGIGGLGLCDISL